MFPGYLSVFCDNDNINKALDVYATYEKVTLGGNFNGQIGENCTDTFMYQHNLQSINKEPLRYKNLIIPVA